MKDKEKSKVDAMYRAYRFLYTLLYLFSLSVWIKTYTGREYRKGLCLSAQTTPC